MACPVKSCCVSLREDLHLYLVIMTDGVILLPNDARCREAWKNFNPIYAAYNVAPLRMLMLRGTLSVTEADIPGKERQREC